MKFSTSSQEELVTKLITNINRSDVEREIPGLPAHIIFMAVRFVDSVNDERLMQSYLANVITSVKKIVSVCLYYSREEIVRNPKKIV